MVSRLCERLLSLVKQLQFDNIKWMVLVIFLAGGV